MIAMKKIQLLPAREQVASVLREAILKRELKEGEELTLEGTAEQLGVSSMPVREAFQILATDGLIKLRPNKGAIVLGVNEKTIRDHYETRALLESEAAARASQKGKDISDIVYAYDTTKKALDENDFGEYSRGNEAFHMSIWTAADNEKMKTILCRFANSDTIIVILYPALKEWQYPNNQTRQKNGNRIQCSKNMDFCFP